MVPNTKLKTTVKNSRIFQVLQPFFLFFNIIGCTSFNTHLQFSWLSSAHTVLVMLLMMAVTSYVLCADDEDTVLEESTVQAGLIDRIKVACAAGAATACTTINMLKSKTLINLITDIEQFSGTFRLRARPFRWMLLRSFCLTVLLASAGVQEIIIEPETFKPLQITSFVEYYCHLVILLTEYQFAVFVRVLEGLLMNEIKKLKRKGRRTKHSLQQSVRSELLLKKFSEDLLSIFGVQIVVAVSSSFVVCIVSSYFALLYIIKWFTRSTFELPTMTVMYTAELFAMEMDHIILADVTKYFQSDPVLQTYLQGRQEWIMYAGDVLILDFGLITDIAGANTTFLVILLQFGLRPC